MTEGIVIVGAGHCGVSAAHGARMAGYQGRITLIGDDTQLPYERPPLSKWDADGPPLRPIFPDDWYQSHDIDLRRSTQATSIDRNTQLVTLSTNETLPYAKLLLATGAAPQRLPADALNGAQPRYLRSYSDALTLARNISAGADVLIIGGGFIGLELAACLSARKAFVHVVEAHDRILARAVPLEISQMVQQLHADRGVSIHTATSVTTIEDDVAFLSSEQGVRAEHVIIGIGSAPITYLADQAGLKVENGIVVDERFATQEPNIFAAGDCCNVPVAGEARARFESWQVAADQGFRAGQAMAGITPDPAPPPWFWSDQFDHTLQVVGTRMGQASHILRPLAGGGAIALETDSDGHITYAAGFAHGNAVGRDIKIIQKLMEAGVTPDPAALADPKTPLKTILRQR